MARLSTTYSDQNPRREEAGARLATKMEFKGGSVSLESARHHRTLTTLSQHENHYSLAGLVVATLCIVLGVVLFYLGVSASTSWSAKYFGAKFEFLDMAPGAILFAVGVLVVFITRRQFSASRRN
jgi:cytochrome c biogenesis protein CcdA